MRKIFAAAMLSAIALAIVPAHAGEGGPFRGTIALSTGTVGRLERCAYTTGSGSGLEQGTFGYILPVTAGYAFALKADPGSVADFEIAFLTGPPASCDSTANGVAVQWNTHNAPLDDTSDEIGEVPADAQFAIINMFAGPPNSSFTFTQDEL